MNPHISVLTIKDSHRILTLSERLHQAGFDNYTLYHGRVTEKRGDGLFENIKAIISDHYTDPYCVLAEDDILPTAGFTPENLLQIAQQGTQLSADIILGGIKEGSRILPVTDKLLSVHNYRGSQLMIIFQKCYDSILNSKISQEFEVMCSYSDKIKKFVSYPFMALQMDGPSRFISRQDHQRDYADFENKISLFLEKAKTDNSGK